MYMFEVTKPQAVIRPTTVGAFFGYSQAQQVTKPQAVIWPSTITLYGVFENQYCYKTASGNLAFNVIFGLVCSQFVKLQNRKR